MRDADAYAELSAAMDELKALDREIDGAVAAAIEAARRPFLTQQLAAQAKVEAAAARLLSSRDAVRMADTKTDGAARVVVHAPSQDPVPHVPARRIKLLKILDQNPAIGFYDIAMRMYSSTDRSHRSALSAEFSNMKRDGLVDAVDKGQFKLTQLARRVLAQQLNTANGAGGH